MKFAPEQQRVLDTLNNSKRSVVLTGVAGCGKSTILREYLRKKSRDDVLITAPTGIAALNVGGVTIHRAFGLGPNFDATNLQPYVNPRVQDILYHTETIIVDEVSMVRADLFTMMDIILRHVCKNEAFGGKRMILVGDLYQLPPVVKKEERGHLNALYNSPDGWFFTSPAFRYLDPEVFFLSKSYRQTDGEFVDLLNRVRNRDRSVVTSLNKLGKAEAAAPKEAPFLCAYKADMTSRNVSELVALKNPIATVKPTTSGDTTLAPKELLVPIQLCKGARIMTTRNAPRVEGEGKPKYVNGSLGTVTHIDEYGIHVLIDGSYSDFILQQETFDVVNLERDEDNKLKYKVVGAVVQYPLQLSWAITVHKSQGATFANAVIDMGKGAFAHGQLYVALSRLTTGEGLHLAQKLRPSDLILDQVVVDFCNSFLAQADAVAE